MRPVLLAGLDLVAPRLPDDAERFALPRASASLADPLAAIRSALERPLKGAPLVERVGPRSQVLIVVEPPAHLVPMGEVQPLALALKALTELLRTRGLPQRNVKLLIANGLEHRPAMTELATALGLEITGGYDVQTFDAEALDGFRDFPDGANGTQPLSRALGSADLIIDVSVRAHGGRAPLSNLVEGLATYRSLRELHAPEIDAAAHAIRRAQALARSLPIFSLALVQSQELLTPAFHGMLASSVGLTTSARAWNRLPFLARRRMAALFRSASSPVAVVAGDPIEVEDRADELAVQLSRVPHGPEVDIVIIGVPDLSPDAPGARSNPVLSAHLGLVTQLGQVRHRLRNGGAVILAGPLSEQFDRALHLPYVEFYERVLRVTSKGTELAERFEVDFSGRPELVAAYRKKGAVHGAVPFQRWYAIERARRGLRVYAAGGGPAAAQRVGIEPAENVESAIDRAREALALTQPKIAVLDTLQLSGR